MPNFLIESDSNHYIKRKVEELVLKYGFDTNYLTTYDLDLVNLMNVIEDADTLSFLSANKVIIGKNLNAVCFENKKHFDSLLKYLATPNEDVLLIFTTDNLDKRKKVVKDFLKNINVVNTSYNVKEIIKELFLDYSVSDKVINLLEIYYQDNLERLINEINKLKVAFINDKKIDYNQAKELIIKPLNMQEELSFELVRNIALKEKKMAINTYQELLSYNVESYSLLGLLENQYRLLYQIKVLLKNNYQEKDIANILEVHPFRIKKSLELIRFYSQKELSKLLKRLANIDLSIKNGDVSNEITIDLILLNL